jgi:hypothetical protein
VKTGQEEEEEHPLVRTRRDQRQEESLVREVHAQEEAEVGWLHEEKAAPLVVGWL